MNNQPKKQFDKVDKAIATALAVCKYTIMIIAGTYDPAGTDVLLSKCITAIDDIASNETIIGIIRDNHIPTTKLKEMIDTVTNKRTAEEIWNMVSEVPVSKDKTLVGARRRIIL